MDMVATINLSDYVDISVIPTILIDDEEREKQEHRERHISFCGSIYQTIDPSSGGYRTYQVSCGYWRYCPKCFQSRAEQFAAWGEQAQKQAGPYLRVANLDKGTASKLIRKLGDKDRYLRIPTSEDEVIVLFDVSGIGGTERYTKGSLIDVDTLDWSELANTPEGSRYTGYLGREKKEAPKEPYISITVPQFVVQDLDSKEISAAWKEASSYTDHLDPDYDEEDLEYACWLRMQTFRESIEERGGVIADETSRYVRVWEHLYKRWGNRDETTSEVEGEAESTLGILPEEVRLSYQKAFDDLFGAYTA